MSEFWVNDMGEELQGGQVSCRWRSVDQLDSGQNLKYSQVQCFRVELWPKLKNPQNILRFKF